MVNKVKNALKDKLSSLYPTYNIYLEDIQSAQKLKPALRIKVDNKTTENQREKTTMIIKLDLVWTIEEDNKNELYWDISDKLDEALEYLSIDNTLIRTREKISEILEGELHYKFDIHLNLEKEVQPVNPISGIQKDIKFNE